jgi:hypothetical protein
MELIDANELLKHEAPAKTYGPEMLVIGKGYVLNALRYPEDGWRADAAEKRADEAEATVRRMRALLEEVLDGSVDASTYPDGPCLERDLRKRIKAELANDKITHGPEVSDNQKP